MENETHTAPAAPPAQTESRGFVLIVDDEPQNRMLLRDPLEASGYEVAEAENGMQALQRIAERLPDVILLDVMMPKLDGFEVCRRLKSYNKTAPIPVIIVTALSERKERIMGIEAGATDFINKPIDIQEVSIRIKNAVHSKRLYDALQAEQAKSERLLLNILPAPIAERMKQGETTIAELVPEATVLLADLVGFTTLSAVFGAEQIVSLLNEIFSAFDSLAEKRGLEKIKSIGDGYLAVGGIPENPNHTKAVVELAFDMFNEIEQFNRQYNTSLHIRIGICTGPIIAGVIGRNKFAYDIWGDAVNVACRLASMAEISSILVSESTYNELKQEYKFNGPQKADIKGRGELAVYTLIGK